MMSFIQFAAVHGVVIDRLESGRWCRVKTTDKPSHRNGAYKFLGDVGFVQNWATMTEPSVWRDDSSDKGSYKAHQQAIKQSLADDSARHQKAAQKAQWILSQCELKPHAYFIAKGFPDVSVNVWTREGQEIAALPMRIGRDVVGVQLIDDPGQKKFLTGQRTSGASFVFGQGLTVLCEGYATALSVHHSLKQMKVGCAVHVCFSAGNMEKVSKYAKPGLVIADNDASGTGERSAKAIGWPFWMSDIVGEDADDFRRRSGFFALGMKLKVMAMRLR